MENEFVAKFFQDIDEDILLQLFLETSMVMEGELVRSWFVYGLVYPLVYTLGLFRSMFIH